MSQPKSKLPRRTLFAGAATVGAAAAAVTLMPSAMPDLAAQPAQALIPPPDKGGGYQLSAHVKKYYKTTLI